MFECRHLPLALPASLAAALEAAYREPHRAYHNTTHIRHVLSWFDVAADDLSWQHPAEAYVAIVFHDAVYVPGAKDNEARSAEWARRSQLPVDLELAARWIELTAQHGALTAQDVDGDAALFLDCDMAILSEPPEQYDAYAAAIRREYAAIPDAAYRAGRAAFLQSVLAKERIYLSEYFHDMLGAQALENVARELATLA